MQIFQDFPNTGISLINFNENQLSPIKNEINKIIKHFDKSIKFNKQLAGNIKYEYELIDSKEYISNLIMPYIVEYENKYQYLKNIIILNKSLELQIDKVWVNFMQKNEFNPIHTHSGIFSFVIWIDIPYNIKDEMNTESSKNSNANIPGHFQFIYTNSLGKICNFNIPADKTFNNKGLIFPSTMNHAVMPFKTSNNYRISVSGNFNFKV